MKRRSGPRNTRTTRNRGLFLPRNTQKTRKAEGGVLPTEYTEYTEKSKRGIGGGAGTRNGKRRMIMRTMNENDRGRKSGPWHTRKGGGIFLPRNTRNTRKAEGGDRRGAHGTHGIHGKIEAGDRRRGRNEEREKENENGRGRKRGPRNTRKGGREAGRERERL